MDRRPGYNGRLIVPFAHAEILGVRFGAVVVGQIEISDSALILHVTKGTSVTRIRIDPKYLG